MNEETARRKNAQDHGAGDHLSVSNAGHDNTLDLLLLTGEEAVIPAGVVEDSHSHNNHESTDGPSSLANDTLREKKWMTKYHELIAFKQQHGHFNVTEGSAQFVNWVQDQRRAHSKGKLRRDRVKLLEDIGFTWSNPIWLEKYNELLAFKEKHGHVRVPVSYENRRLASWVRNLRHDQINGKLRSDRKKTLDEIGFVWRKTKTERENDQLRRENEQLRKQLQKTKSKSERAAKRLKRGHDNDNNNYDDDDDDDDTAEDETPKDTIHHRRWMERYGELVAFKEKNGHFNVTDANGGQRLGDWMRDQRRRQRRGELQRDRKKRLQDIGFTWTNPVWMEHYNELFEFKEKNGHCRVPSTHENQGLRRWVKNLRHEQQAGKLRADRKKLLDDIGFLWTKSISDDQERLWMERYNALVEYKEKNGNCKVRNSEDQLLVQWILNQRRAKRTNKLRADRQKLLEEIDFVWSDPKRGEGTKDDLTWMYRYPYAPVRCLRGLQPMPYSELMTQERQTSK